MRTCVYENLSTLQDVRCALQAEVKRYNSRQVHSTTREIPNIRFERARAAGNSLFRKFTIPQPYTSSQDVFCLREKRMVNGSRRISLFDHTIQVPRVPLREYVDIHLVPAVARQLMRIRVWWNTKTVHALPTARGLSCLLLTSTGVQFSTLANLGVTPTVI